MLIKSLFLILFFMLATPMFDGTEDGFWQDKSVVVARIIKQGNDNGQEFISIDILGVLHTNNFIPMHLEHLKYFVAVNSAIKSSPQVGDICIILLDFSNENFELPNYYLKFFSSGCAIEKLSSLKDPNFEIAQKKIQNARSISLLKNKKSIIKKN